MSENKLHDRGLIKWRGFMMPEHMSLIAEIDWDMHRQPKPLLDDYQIEEMESRLQFAFESKIPVRITEHIGGLEETLTGTVVRLNPHTKEISVKVGEFVERIKWADVVGVELVDD